MDQAIRSIALAACLLAVSFATAAESEFLVTGSRFGCVPIPGCGFYIVDNGPLDLDADLHEIEFSVPMVGDDYATYAISGRAVETATRDERGRVSSILIQLTDTTMEWLSGGSTGGQIRLLSSMTLNAPYGSSGSLTLDGEYRNFTDGVIGLADVVLNARVDGLLLGPINPPEVNGAASPVPFVGFDSSKYDLSARGRMDVSLDFEASAGSGFVLADSKAFARTIPEPATLWLMALGLALVALWRRRSLA